MRREQKKLGIVGAGIAGLSTAWRLHQTDPNVAIVVLEKTQRLGGRIETDRRMRADHGAHYFLHSDTHVWDLVRCLGLETQRIEDQRQMFAIGGLPVPASLSSGDVQRLFGPGRRTARLLSQLLREAEDGALSGQAGASPTFKHWLRRRLGGDNEALNFIEVLLKGEVNAPHSHVSADLGLRCLESLLGKDERWYSLPGGMTTLVRRLEKDLRRAGTQIYTGWRVRDVRRGPGRVVITGARNGRAESCAFDAVVVTSPLDGSMTVAGSRRRRCYHGYISVLFRVSDTLDRSLRSRIMGGLYTDRPLNYVTFEQPRVYRALIPDSGSLPGRWWGRVIPSCRNELCALLPDLAPGLKRLGRADWSVKRWKIGLPCSQPKTGVRREQGVFWAGDWKASFPSVDGAVKSGLEAAAQVHGFLMRRGE